MQAKEEEQQAAAADAVFPVILQIMENCIFNARDPIVLGCEVEEGIAKVGFFGALCVRDSCGMQQSCSKVIIRLQYYLR